MQYQPLSSALAVEMRATSAISPSADRIAYSETPRDTAAVSAKSTS